MDAYTDFAQVYDELMDDTPYEEWCEFLLEIFRRYGVDDLPLNDSSVINGGRKEDADTDGKTEALTDDMDCASETTEQNLAQERNTILDLGCGTGTLTELLARRGYDMIGVDNAQEMLRIAIEKRERSGLDILYLLQRLRQSELSAHRGGYRENL